MRTQYAKNGDIHIAYQVHGAGPIDLVLCSGAATHLEVLQEDPSYRRHCLQLASFARLVCFDKRGMGLSDRVRSGTLEERMEDMHAVLDAVGSTRAALMGVSEGGPMSMLFAASYPERTRALILCGAEVREQTTADWIAATAGAGEVVVSSTVRDPVAGSGLQFVERGVHQLKGIGEPWRLFQVVA
ncbi:MAG TPA: alpha/beta hydrolase [Burkholderiaceae bacterium]|nr:alpha/beta hydrolase [Burkholderiaceae bacterium]